jgi:DNA-binding NarL/FixJ family response regulator
MAAREITTEPVRVLLADSHALYRESLRTFLVASGLEVTAIATHGQQAIDQARAARFSVALIDLDLAGLGGIETTGRLSVEMPWMPILILAMSHFDAELQEGIRRGASGCVFKGDPPEVLLRAVLGAASGRPVLTPQLARFLARALFGRNERGRDVSLLTPEEADLLMEIEASPKRQPAATPIARTILDKLHLLHRA